MPVIARLVVAKPRVNLTRLDARRPYALNMGDGLTSRSEDTFIPLDKAVGIMFVLQQALTVAADIALEQGWCLERHDLKLIQYWANVKAVLRCGCKPRSIGHWLNQCNPTC